jgi:putative transposase
VGSNSSVVKKEEKTGRAEMGGPKAAELELREEEQKELEELVRRHQTPQQLAQRGRMILAAAKGTSNGQIAREQAVCVDTVRMWRKRWISLQPVPLKELAVQERLEDLPRAGRPVQIRAEQVCQLVAMACEQPKEGPISHWTGREIADEAKRRGIIKEISPRHASRLLQKKISSPI